MKCANCGKEIEDMYYKVMDNYLQVNFFETDELNCFCSQECVCEFLSVDYVCVDEKGEDDE